MNTATNRSPLFVASGEFSRELLLAPDTARSLLKRGRTRLIATDFFGCFSLFEGSITPGGGMQWRWNSWVFALSPMIETTWFGSAELVHCFDAKEFFSRIRWLKSVARTKTGRGKTQPQSVKRPYCSYIYFRRSCANCHAPNTDLSKDWSQQWLKTSLHAARQAISSNELDFYLPRNWTSTTCSKNRNKWLTYWQAKFVCNLSKN